MPFFTTYCIGSTPTPIPLGASDWQHYSPPPTWGYITGGSQFIYTAFTVPGIYTCDIWQEDTPGSETQVTIIAKDCSHQCQPLCSLKLAWLTVEGGWSSYDFGLAKNAKINARRIGSDVRYKFWHEATGNIIQHSQKIKDVYAEIRAISGFLKIHQLPLLEQLRYSIQVYEYDTINNNYTTPLLLDKEDFELNKCGNGLVKFEFKLIKAKEIIIQSQ